MYRYMATFCAVEQLIKRPVQVWVVKRAVGLNLENVSQYHTRAVDIHIMDIFLGEWDNKDIFPGVPFTNKD